MEHLENQTGELALARDVARRNVHLERDKLAKPYVASVLAQAQAARRAKLEALAVLRAALRNDYPSFPESAWKATHETHRARDALVGDLCKGLNKFALDGGGDDPAIARVSAKTRAVLDQLLIDPLAPLPSL